MRDDIELLKECDSGVKMGIQGIAAVIDDAYGKDFKNLLEKYEEQHVKILDVIHGKLNEAGASIKEPHPVARAMANMSTDMKMMMNNSDEKIADIMMDGCNMGIKSVSKYMNQYAAASKETMQIANDIVVLEQNFMNELRQYL